MKMLLSNEAGQSYIASILSNPILITTSTKLRKLILNLKGSKRAVVRVISQILCYCYYLENKSILISENDE